MSYTSTIQAEGSLLSYWRLGDTAGSSTMADSKGSVTLTTGISGTGGTLGSTGALTGSGDTDTALLNTGSNKTAGSANVAVLSGLTAWTIEAWVKTSITSAQMLYSESVTGTTGTRVAMSIGRTAGKISAEYRDSAGGTTIQMATGATSVNDNAWHHVAVTRSATTFTVYVDGVQDAQATFTVSTQPTTGVVTAIPTLASGVHPVTSTQVTLGLTGAIDEVAVYNAALNSATLTAHKNAATTSVPSNTSAPVVSGTAAVGATLTTTDGVWANGPTGYSYQWKRDGSNIAGATLANYTVQAADASHTVTCAVTAANGAGSSSPATSNGIAIPAAPGNVSPPVIATDGTPATGETISCSTGTWSGSPTAFAYQWNRAASPIGGATSSTYVLQVADESVAITCTVTATNGGGNTSATSASIVPGPVSPISGANIVYAYSGGSGNTNAAASIGGAPGGTVADGALNSVFGPIAGTVAQSGGTFYSVLYVQNTHPTTTDPSTVVFCKQQPGTPGLEIAVAVPAEAAGVNVPALASRTTAPGGVTWYTGTTSGGAPAFGDIAAGSFRGLYVRLTIAAGTGATASDQFVLSTYSSGA